jgi:Rhodopirellula transposase DDE domain
MTPVGGKTRTDRAGKVESGWDHDPPATEKFVPFGVLMLLSGALTLVFGSGETSDFWVDALQVWWRGVRAKCQGIRQLVIYVDNGGENSGRRTPFLKRMVQFADGTGLVIRLVSYPPYHSKSNPIERCWSSLEKKWNGVLLNCGEVIWACALRMTWKGMHPVVERLLGPYAKGVSVPKEGMAMYEARLERSATLPDYDITIRPKIPKYR